MRDAQRQRVYDAEFMLRGVMENAARMEYPVFDFYGSTLVLPRERKFATLESMQAYTDQVLSLNWVRATWGSPSPIRLRKRQGATKAHYQAGEIAIPTQVDWAMREIVLLHEIAHHLSPCDSHGSEFAGGHWSLVNEIMGSEVGIVYSWCQDQNAVTRNFKRIAVSA